MEYYFRVSTIHYGILLQGFYCLLWNTIAGFLLFITEYYCRVSTVYYGILLQGFYCMESGFPEGVKADGCIKSCRPDEILIVDVGKYDWECVPKSFS